ncbi:MAG: hypothetical protein HOV67_00860 [Kribbellaceae bacterium]|nr:hypothetical protein [Kribbellaceae bacterium]
MTGATPVETPAQVTVSMVDHATTVDKLHVAGVAFKVTRADGAKPTGAAVKADGKPDAAHKGRVVVKIDYSGFKDAYGGDYAGRLQVFAYPACFLTTPTAAGCSVPTPVASTNDPSTSTLTADVDADPDPTVVAAPTTPGASPSTSAGPAAPSPAISSTDPGGTATPSTAPSASSSSPSSSSASPSASGAASLGGTSVRPASFSLNSRTAETVREAAAPLAAAAATGSSSGTVYVATAQAASNQGTYQAAPMTPADRWSTDLHTGAFTYSYPFSTVPAPGASTPKLGLFYNSQSVDGHTAVNNPQASQSGIGWTAGAAQNFIERDYEACGLQGVVWNGAPDQDMCWHTDNATISLNGMTAELIRDVNTGVWRVGTNDNGWTIQRLTGANNGDNRSDAPGEYWVVTTQDGTKYYFGETTNAAWQMPVFGAMVNPSVAPCHTSTFNTSWCNMPWRWMLDRVVDPHGTTASYKYGTETNYYDGLNGSIVYGYVRGGYLQEVDYGYQGSGQATAPGKMVFWYTSRCNAGTNLQYGNTCPAMTAANASSWPDVPIDLQCPVGVGCTVYTPSFWSVYALTRVESDVYDQGNSAYRAADTYDMSYYFPGTSNAADPNANQSGTPQLWLSSITHTGADGGSLASASVYTYGQQLSNRLLTSGATPLNMWRVNAITNELGAESDVQYGLPNACSTTSTPAQNSSTQDCFWEPDPVTAANPFPNTYHWYNKYAVTATTTYDTVTGIDDSYVENTQYLYGAAAGAISGEGVGAAWHHAEAPAAASSSTPSWDDYRGYAVVQVRKGEPTDPGFFTIGTLENVDQYLYYRGQYDDCSSGCQAGQTPVYRNETVTTLPDMNGATATYHDDQTHAGQLLIHRSLNPADLSVKTFDKYMPGPMTITATGYPITGVRDHYVWSLTSKADTHQSARRDGSVQQTETDTAFDTFGNTTSTTLDGDSSPAAAQSCTQTRYATSADGTWEAPVSVRTFTGVCVSGYSNTVTKQTDTYYDGSTVWSSAPTAGDPTQVWTFTKNDGATHVVTANTFDSYGRITETTDGRGVPTDTTYTPASGIPTSVAVTNTLGQTTTTTYDVARALPLRVTGPNGDVTTKTYDPLGRPTSVRLPADAAGKPSYKFSYHVAYTIVSGGSGNRSANTSQAAYSETDKLQADGTYLPSYTIVDAMGRTVEAETPTAGGIAVTQTNRDSLGRTTSVVGPDYLTNPGGSYYSLASAGPSTVTSYDMLNRPVSVSSMYNGAVVTRSGINETTTTAYFADQTVATPPAPAGTTTTRIDGLGRTFQVDQAGPSGTVTTKYSHDTENNLTGITDAAGHQTSYTYDLVGHRLTTSDPDAGSSSAVYDAIGNPIASTDAKGQTIITAYDTLGRKTATSAGDGATGVWYLNESSYNQGVDTLADSSTGNNSATGYGILSYSNAGPRAGLTATGFDGSSGYLATNGSILNTTGGYTVSAWAKLNATGSWGDVVTQDGNKASAFFLQYDAGDNAWSFSMCPTDTANCSANRVHAATAAATGTWTHLVGTFDAATGKMTLYVNGTAAATGTNTTPFASTGPLAIGRGKYNGANTDYFNGNIADVRVYPRAVTATEASNLYNSGSVTGTSTPSQTFNYDTAPGGVGKPASATSYTNNNAYMQAVTGYDIDGRATGATTTIPAAEGALAGSYTSNTTYDIAGHTATVSYPAAGGLPAETVTAAYNNLDQPTTLTGTQTYVTATSFNGLGQLTGRTLGSGTGSVTRTIGYEPDTLAVSNLTATIQGASGSTSAQNDTYNRNADGNVTSLADATTGQAQCFGYDSLSRMTDAYTASSTSCTRGATTFGPAPYDLHYTFDNIGDTQTVTDNITNANNQTFAYGDSAHSHAPTSSGSGRAYSYDANGNMTSRTTAANGAQTLSWNSQQQLTGITAGTSTTGFVYGPDGSRLIRHDPAGKAVLFVAGEELNLSGSTVTATRYYTAADGATVAMRTSAGVTWLLGDAQGTASITVNATTGAATRQYYNAYGNQRGGNSLQSTTDKAFLGHVQDYGTGLLQDGARYYDPTIGHFISPDPLNDGKGDQLNAYAYADNNPATLSDPSGLRTPTDERPPTTTTTPPKCSFGTNADGSCYQPRPYSPPPPAPPKPSAPPTQGQSGSVGPVISPKPAYTTSSISIGAFGAVIGISKSVTIGGKTYYAPAIGVGSPGLGGSQRNGYLPPGTNVDSFVSGWSINAEACMGEGVTTCADLVWGNPGRHVPLLNELGGEYGNGLGQPGGSITASYGFTQEQAVHYAENHHTLQSALEPVVQGAARWSAGVAVDAYNVVRGWF